MHVGLRHVRVEEGVTAFVIRLQVHVRNLFPDAVLHTLIEAPLAHKVELLRLRFGCAIEHIGMCFLDERVTWR